MWKLIGCVALLVLAAAPPRMLAAQWGGAAEIGVARFAGTSRDSSGITVGPYRPTTFGLRLDRGFEGDGGVGGAATRVGMTVLYAQTGLAGEQDGLVVVDYNAASLWEVGPVVSIRLARFGAGVEARVEGGPVVDFWELDQDRRTRVGARVGVGLECPLGGRFTWSLRATGVLSGSIINPNETPPGVERRATRRGGVSVGLRYHL
jgi:hypothetical protein